MSVRRLLGAVAWTALLVVALFAADRWLLGRAPMADWVELSVEAARAASAEPTLVPSYLPENIGWPPARTVVRAGAFPGWWLGMVDRGDGMVRVWLGSGEPPPPALGTAAACLNEDAHCAEPWHLLSRPLSDGRVVHLISDLDPLLARRTLDGLRETP
jgi:hypothetical protein